MTAVMASTESSQVTLFHLVLAEFKYGLATLSTFDLYSRETELTVEFVVKSLEIYLEEGDTRPVLSKIPRQQKLHPYRWLDNHRLVF